MKIKLYMHVKHSIDAMIDLYTAVFEGTVVKRHALTSAQVVKRQLPNSFVGVTYYASIKLFNEITVMFSLWSETKNQPYGTNVSYVLNFGADRARYEATYERLKTHAAFTMQYDRMAEPWGTEIVKFHDHFDNAWVLELVLKTSH